MINKQTTVYIAGHRGMVGSAIWRKLQEEGFTNLIGRDSKELDLRNQQAVDDFFKLHRPGIVIDAAAKVGGILANSQLPYKFLMDNLQIQNNLISTSLKYEVAKFIFLGSSCIYPKLAPQPLKEEYLLTGPLEPTNEWYALAKIAGVKAVEAIRKQYGLDYISLMPTNLYGPNDNFDLHSSHVLPAMIRKFHEAKENQHSSVQLWGTGTPLREFLYVDDLASAVHFTLTNALGFPVYNVGSGSDLSIASLAALVKHTVGYSGEILWDYTKPDGTPRKLLDTTRLETAGWTARVPLNSGIEMTYRWYTQHSSNARSLSMES